MCSRGDLRARVLGSWLLLWGLAGASAPRLAAREWPDPGIVRGKIDAGAIERTYLLYRPYRRAPSAAALIVLHGGSGGSGERIRTFIGRDLETLADELGVLIVYADGVGGSWNDCRARALHPAKLARADDVGFVRALAAELAREHGVDPSRIFALGYSNGGHLALRLALEAPEVVRGVAVFGASLPVTGELDCVEQGAAVPVMIVHGTADRISPYEGGEAVAPDGTGLGRVRSAEETLVYFGGLAGHTEDPVPQVVVAGEDRAGAPSVERWSWSEAAGPRVVLYTIHGGGHTVPSPRARFPELVGAIERRFDGLAAAMEFFGLRERLDEMR
jgi:polyhydroxybutyrate depolymerase